MNGQQLRRVLTPIKVGPVTVKNRILRASHGTKLGDGGVTDRMIAYHLERARGGVGLTVLEGAQIMSLGAAGGGLLAWSDDIVPGYKRLMAAIEPTGMKVYQQLWHGGATYADWRQPPVAPSALPGLTAGIP